MPANLNRAQAAAHGRAHGRSGADRPEEAWPTATPAVRAEVLAGCAGDPAAAGEVLAALSDAQRRGHRVLPDPLPLTPSVTAYVDRCGPCHDDLPLLLLVALTDVDRFGTLRRASGRGVGEWERLAAVAGGVLSDDRVYVDPRTRIWAQAQATASQRRRAHKALALAFEAEGEEERALWHQAKGNLDSAATRAGDLLEVAVARNARGDARTAVRYADEAARHGGVPIRRRAAIVGGLAALSGGWLDDALDLLEPVVVGGSVAERQEALGAFLVAAAMRRGTLPALGAVRTLCGEEPSPAIAGTAAILCAERGARSEARAWLMHARRGERGDQRGALFASWCALLAGEAEGESRLPDGRSGPGGPAAPLGPLAVIAAALRAGLEGDHDQALRIVRAAQSPTESGSDPLLTWIRRGPLQQAHLVVVEALLLTWAGRLRLAYTGLGSAALSLPVALPFAGLAAVLARRLELAIDGRPGHLSDLLAQGDATATGPGRHLDRAIEAHLHGRADEAAAALRLWVDQGAPGPVLGLPGLDEVGPVGAHEPSGPADARRAARLRRRIRMSGEGGWVGERSVLAEEARTIVSPFERGRVEALLGAQRLSRGERCDGERHLALAVALFDDAGADAWRTATQYRLDRAAEVPDTAEEPGAPVACRALWEPLMTTRELEVALRIADGRTNRQIAECLHLSVRTVEVYVGRLFAKLDVRSRGELIALAHRTAFHS
ncbi:MULTISPECIES: LuxR C-terminal-related transcriptional regulator [Bacteria]|uniref:LuxR C-terminal-related transcriptional regulator n=1 Tax=Bacteria TaxID=2 RepID=UPI003C7D12AB